jgi:hypothetical protein
MRRSEKLICTGLHFDEDQDLFLAIAADQVNLAAAAGFEISIKDLKRLFLEKPFCGCFAFPSQLEMRR